MKFYSKIKRDQDIKEAKLRLFSVYDKVLTPQEKGLGDFLFGKNLYNLF